MLGFSFLCCEHEPGLGGLKGDDQTILSIDLDHEIIDSLSRQLPGGEGWEDRRDSLIQSILPLLVGDPTEKRFIGWFEIKNNWIPLFDDSESLLFYITYAAKQLDKEEDQIRKAKILNAAARAYNMEGSYVRGGELSQQAYEIALIWGDSVTMGWAQGQLAEPFILGKDTLGAQVHIKQMLQIAKAIKNRGLEGSVLIRTGAMYGHVGDFEKLVYYSKKALAFGKKHNLKRIEVYGVINACIGLGYIGRNKEAIALIQESAFLLNDGFASSKALLNFSLFENYYTLKDYNEASKYLSEACRISNQIGFFLGTGYCKEATARLYEKEEAPWAALEAYKAYHEYYEEKVGAEAKKKLRELEIQQRVRNKDLEIERLELAKKEDARIDAIKKNRMILSFFALLLALLLVFLGVFAKKEIRLAQQRKKIAEAKLEGLRFQMNPHFIFNTLNGVQNFILKSEKFEAYAYLSKFGELLRSITRSSASFGISVDKEVKLLRNYLELEKLRFRESFDYEIIVEPGLMGGEGRIPGMIIQPIVENAILHGLSLLPYAGELKIEVCAHGQGVEIVVTDNGRGRETATKIAEENKGKHLSVSSVNTRKRLDFLHEIGCKGASVKIEDLYKEGKGCGTVVTIYLPFLEDKHSNA